ncbi:MAG: hypothetical protein JSS75_02055 [Bacteroidetes bacterium]|nr:hypothetical protein [Bacteroidota bacterium]
MTIATRIIVVFFVCGLTWSPMYAQHRYARQLQLSGRNINYASALATSNGSYITGSIQNYTTSAYSWFLARLDRDGQVLWAKELKAPGQRSLSIQSMFADTASGGVECMVQLYEQRPDGRWWVEDVTIDSNGHMRGNHAYLLNFSMRAARTPDGGMVLAGLRDGSGAGEQYAVVMKLSPNWIPQWERTIVRAPTDDATQTQFDGVVVEPSGACICYGTGVLGDQALGYSGLALKFGPDGTLLGSWVNTNTNGDIVLDCGTLLANGSVALGGQTMGTTGDAAVYVLDSNLHTTWARRVDLFGEDWLTGIYASAHGDILAYSETDFDISFGSVDAAIVEVTRFDRVGNIVHIRSLSKGSDILTSHLDATQQGDGLLALCHLKPTGTIVSPTLVTYLDRHDSSCMTGGASYAFDSITGFGTYTPLLDTTIDVSIDSIQMFSLVDVAYSDSLLCDGGEELPDPPVSVNIPSGYSLYPNPCQRAEQPLMLRLPDSAAAGKYVASIRTAFGAIVRQVTLSVQTGSTPVRIPTAGLTAGAYQLELFDPTQTTLYWRGGFVLE